MSEMRRKVLDKIIRETLFEDVTSYVARGIYDRPIGNAGMDDDESTVPPDVPLKPTEMMATQLADERPPIEDEEYTPTNTSELSRAASAVAQLVPSGQVEFFYKELHRLLDDVTERENKPEEDELNARVGGVEEKPLEPVKADANESVLREQGSGSGWGDDDPRYGSDPVDDEFEEVAEEMAVASQSYEGETLEDLADRFGFSGAPGVRQYIEKILRKMEYFTARLQPGELTALQDHAIGEYIKLMASGDYIDAQDVADLQSAPGAVKELDSFRFFFVSAFVMPGYQEITRQAKKRLMAALETMNVPQPLHQTILHQATGAASRDPDHIEAKLNKAAAGMSDRERIDLASSLRTGFHELVKLTEPTGDLIAVSMEKWDKMSKGRRAKTLEQALQNTQEFQAEAVG